ncbi:hypothetical protein CRX72_24900 [Pantoea sp. BRM17]|nr:hypothetical protein CRX72_24900 [Pantoea sp. BRM17]
MTIRPDNWFTEKYVQDQQMLLATLVRFHRKAVKQDEIPRFTLFKKKQVLPMIFLLRLGTLLNNQRQATTRPDALKLSTDVARRVLETTEQLYLQWQEQNPKQANPQLTALLKWAALLHEVGLTINHSGMQRHSAYILQHSNMPGFMRKAVFVPGLAILCGVFDALAIRELRLSDGALREGVLYEMEGRFRHQDIRSRTAQSLANHYVIDSDLLAWQYRLHGWQYALGASGSIKAACEVLLAMGEKEKRVTPDSLDMLVGEVLKHKSFDALSLPGLSEGEKGRKLVIDIGGGSTELVIGEDFEPQLVESRRMGCVSFANLYFPKGEISQDNFRRARLAATHKLESLALFAERLQGFSAANVTIVGTHTLRIATNAEEFLQRAAEVIPYPIEVISGNEEARLIFMGVEHTQPTPKSTPKPQEFAAIDLGSNSFHMVIARVVDGAMQVLGRLKQRVHLADGLDAQNRLSEEAIVRGLSYARSAS